jgi:hypothetical protein
MSPSLTHELRRMGVHIREEWMAAARDHLRTNVANFDALPLDKQVSRVSAPLIRQSSPRGCYANERVGTVFASSLASNPRANTGGVSIRALPGCGHEPHGRGVLARRGSACDAKHKREVRACIQP